MTCKGMNCTSTDGKNHSPECRAEYAATVAGGRFVKGGEQEAVMSREDWKELYNIAYDRDSFEQFMETAKVNIAESAKSNKQEAVAWTSPERLARIKNNPLHIDTMWSEFEVEDGDVPLYAHPIASAEQDRIDALEEALRLALEFIDDAQITDGQWHWLDEVRPVLSKGASK